MCGILLKLETSGQSQMFRLRQFTVSWKILAHFEIDGSNTSQKNEMGQQKAGNLSGTKKK